MKVPQPFPYQGSKRNLAPAILGYFPEGIATLIEPFAGSAAITLHASAQGLAEDFVINDLNEPLMDLWRAIIQAKLCSLRDTVLSLRPFMDWPLAEGETEQQRTKIRLQRFFEAHAGFLQTVDHARPFFSHEVWSELEKLRKLCWGEAVDYGAFSPQSWWRERSEYLDSAIKNPDAINAQVNRICDVIRDRLKLFDHL